MEGADERRGRWEDTDVAQRRRELYFIASCCCTGGHNFNSPGSLKTVQKLSKACLTGGNVWKMTHQSSFGKGKTCSGRWANICNVKMCIFFQHGYELLEICWELDFLLFSYLLLEFAEMISENLFLFCFSLLKANENEHDQWLTPRVIWREINGRQTCWALPHNSSVELMENRWKKSFYALSLRGKITRKKSLQVRISFRGQVSLKQN